MLAIMAQYKKEGNFVKSLWGHMASFIKTEGLITSLVMVAIIIVAFVTIVFGLNFVMSLQNLL
jgi:hypothetical protein